MRPKIVLLTLAAAFVVLGIVAVFKGVMGEHARNADGQTPGTEAAQPASTNGQVAQASPNSGNPAANSEEWRAAVMQKDLDEVHELFSEIDGTNNPMIVAALIVKVENPEAEVRKAALGALMELRDTNAVPGLQKAVDTITDPRGKVAVLDAIDYLNLPDPMPAVQPPDLLSNYDKGPPPRNLHMNPKFLHKNMDNGGSSDGSQQTPAPNQPQ
jgi:hypothetical protein